MMLTLNTSIPKYNNYSQKLANSPTYNKYPNLAPLQRDTVSFTHTKKTYSENDKQFGIPIEDAEQLRDVLYPSLHNFVQQLSDIFEGDISTCVTDNKPIERIHGRMKSTESIFEKAASRRWNNTDEVRENMKDIVGARIVLKDGSTQNADYVINKITNAVKDNKIEIVEIENYRPEPDLDEDGNIINSYDYTSPKTLTKLKHICDKKFSYIQKRDEDYPTGYTAVHLITKLPGGYFGEIQIMGKEVEKLKEIEDICYKYKSGKSINHVYDNMKPLLEPLRNRTNSLFNKDYTEYTREAYKYQRMKELNPYLRSNPAFKVIPEHLPDNLDFNYLYKMKLNCEKKSKK